MFSLATKAQSHGDSQKKIIYLITICESPCLRDLVANKGFLEWAYSSLENPKLSIYNIILNQFYQNNITIRLQLNDIRQRNR
jgi:hypothetical protein